jgi:hypothetical protein
MGRRTMDRERLAYPARATDYYIAERTTYRYLSIVKFPNIKRYPKSI